MRAQPERSGEDILRALLAEAEAVWGADRIEDLRPAIETTANALWQIGQVVLDPDQEEPDFLASAAR